MFGLMPFGGFLANNLMENLISSMLSGAFTQPASQIVQISGDFSSSDVREKPDLYVLQMYLPGASKESLKVKYIDNYLTVTAKSSQYVRNRQGGYTRYIGNINRSFYFDDIDSEKIDGIFKDGKLILILPKNKQAEANNT